jgi:ABC-2 family transporter protein
MQYFAVEIQIWDTLKSPRDSGSCHKVHFLTVVGTTKIYLPFGSLIGGILYPFGVSFLLPIFVIIIVQEKENRILVMMKINGVKSWAYYFSHYITFYILYASSSLFFLISGGVAQLSFFTQTDNSLLALLFFVWGT